jgi:hypothetical protein
MPPIFLKHFFDCIGYHPLVIFSQVLIKVGHIKPWMVGQENST